MKKIFSSLALAALISPVFASANVANSLDSLLMSNAYNANRCAQDSHFCSCFNSQAVEACMEAMHSPRLCSESNINHNIKRAPDLSGYCRKWKRMLPKGLSNKECVSDLSYYKGHC